MPPRLSYNRITLDDLLEDCLAISRSDEGGEPVEEIGEGLEEEEGDEFLALPQLIDDAYYALHAAQLHEVSDDLHLVDPLGLPLGPILQALLDELPIIPKEPVQSRIAAGYDIGSIEDLEVGEEVSLSASLKGDLLLRINNCQKLHIKLFTSSRWVLISLRKVVRNLMLMRKYSIAQRTPSTVANFQVIKKST